MLQKRLLITDIDNTLFDWFDMWHSSFTSLIKSVLAVVDIDSETLLSQCRTIHQKHGTSEYLFLLDELPATKDLPSELLEELRRKLYQQRQAGLVLYDGVQKTLEILKTKGIRVVAFSESKQFYSAYRLNALGLTKLIDVLYCPDDHDLPAHLEAEALFEGGKIEVLPKSFRKPDPKILLQIIRNQSADLDECLYIGDSETKDIEMAQRAGVDYLWFREGTAHLTDRATDYDLLKKVTHWDASAVDKEQHALLGADKICSITPTQIITNYSELLKYF